MVDFGVGRAPSSGTSLVFLHSIVMMVPHTFLPSKIRKPYEGDHLLKLDGWCSFFGISIG